MELNDLCIMVLQIILCAKTVTYVHEKDTFNNIFILLCTFLFKDIYIDTLYTSLHLGVQSIDIYRNCNKMKYLQMLNFLKQVHQSVRYSCIFRYTDNATNK